MDYGLYRRDHWDLFAEFIGGKWASATFNHALTSAANSYTTFPPLAFPALDFDDSVTTHPHVTYTAELLSSAPSLRNLYDGGEIWDIKVTYRASHNILLRRLVECLASKKVLGSTTYYTISTHRQRATATKAGVWSTFASKASSYSFIIDDTNDLYLQYGPFMPTIPYCNPALTPAASFVLHCNKADDEHFDVQMKTGVATSADLGVTHFELGTDDISGPTWTTAQEMELAGSEGVYTGSVALSGTPDFMYTTIPSNWTYHYDPKPTQFLTIKCVKKDVDTYVYTGYPTRYFWKAPTIAHTQTALGLNYNVMFVGLKLKEIRGLPGAEVQFRVEVNL